jgi:hypothetical protein
MHHIDWAMFQTIVDIDVDATLTQFKVAFEYMDDGCKVVIFNSAHPNGISPPGNDAYVFLGQSATFDLAQYAVKGENRLVIIQMDDCAVENNIKATPSLNGEIVHICTSDDPCLLSSWDSTKKSCVSKPNPANPPCNDGDACTKTDMCYNGDCKGSNLVTCPQVQCQKTSCDHKTGQCTAPIMDTGCPCNDGDACTQVDVCENGQCVGKSPVSCPLTDQCQSPGTCDKKTGTCSKATNKDGECDDGNECTDGDYCYNGGCVSGEEKECPCASQCQTPGKCIPSTGECSAPSPLSGPCDDGDECTIGDYCKDGVCHSGVDKECPCASQCQNPGTCDSETGDCSNPENLGNEYDCDDGNKCTQNDYCEDGVCQSGEPTDCPKPADQCQVKGTCEPTTGYCTPIGMLGEDHLCDDGNACTQYDYCQNGQCVGSNPTSCTVTNQCQKPGTCDKVTGSCSAPIDLTGGKCDDGNACTKDDSCLNGVCTGYNTVECPEVGQCQVKGSCDPKTGVCSDPVMKSGCPCNDGDACTQTDYCQNGQCVGSTPCQCPLPAAQCQEQGTCDSSTGICTPTKMLTGGSCDDGNACTQTDKCVNGVCVGGDNICCKTNKGCGKCVDNCGNDYKEVLNWFGIATGATKDVSAAGGGGYVCPGTKVCCIVKKSDTCYFNSALGICVVDNSIPIH